MNKEDRLSPKVKKIIQRSVSAVFWLAVWFVVAKKVNLELVFPSFSSFASAFVGLFRTTEFYISCLYSIAKILTGWLIGTALGTVFGVMIFANDWLEALISPIVHIVKATPVASFIILALVLMDNSFVPTFVSALIVIPVVCSNVSAGLKSPGSKLREMAVAFKMSNVNRVKYIYLPAVKPYFMSASTTAMGLAWKAGIAAEVICVPAKSIGTAIYNSKVYLDTPSLFAWTAAVIILSVFFEFILKTVTNLFKSKENGNES